MPHIEPFPGWRYNARKIKDLTSVVAPPYDVISPKQQKVLHRKNPYNVVRLIRGFKKKGEGALLHQWQKDGILMKEPRPAIYVYVQDYKEGGGDGSRHSTGRSASRIGFIAAMKLEERFVRRHERTLQKPKEDRLRLLKEVKTNLSPVFGLFEDGTGKVQEMLREAMRTPPVMDVRFENVRHRLFVETDPARIQKIKRAMAPKPLFIADGHHRFEVACQFQKWMRAQGFKSGLFDYAMVYFSDVGHNPIRIFPTHRLVKGRGAFLGLLSCLEKRGSFTKVGGLKALLKRLEKKSRAYEFGMYTKKDGFFIFRLWNRYIPKSREGVVSRLDVAVLHSKVITPCFKIRRIEKSAQIDFTRDAQEAVDRVNHGAFDLAIFLRPTSLEEVLLVSRKGLRMPQKSTYFYPKLLSGLVFRDINHD